MFSQIEFYTSAAKIAQLPADAIAEVAFIGRSNAGKSSAINAITRIKNLARISKQPGRTQLINYFSLQDEHYLVDLPGYGYAKVSKEIKARWEKLITQYLEKREVLKGLILLMDIRHPLMPMDENMLNWVIEAQLPIRILLTKADKLRRGPRLQCLEKVKKALKVYGEQVSLQLFSAQQDIGWSEVEQQLSEWLYPSCSSVIASAASQSSP